MPWGYRRKKRIAMKLWHGFWQRLPQPRRQAKTAALYGIPIQMIRSYISAASETSNGPSASLGASFVCKACGEPFRTLELACQHLRAYSDISPHPYVPSGCGGEGKGQAVA